MFFLFISVRKEGWFYGLPKPEITPHIVCPLISEFFSLSIKWFIPINLSFHSIFLYFFVFLSPTCCSVWLCLRTTVDLFVGFRVSDSYNRVVSIKEVISNLCSSICFIRSRILGILGILGLPIV